LKQQLADEKQRMKEAKDALQHPKLEELDIQKDALKKQFDELTSAENLKAEALKLMMSGQQDDLLALLDSYAPGWRDAGKSFAEMLSLGISDGREKIEKSLSDTLNLLKGTGVASPQTAQAPAQSAYDIKPYGAQIDSQTEKLETDIRLFLSDIKLALADINQAVKQGAKEIYAQFQQPLRDGFSMIGARLDGAAAAISSLSSALAAKPGVTVTNNFNGVTAADVPHMVDRENTALLRKLQASRV